MGKILELNLLLQKAIPLIDLSQFDRWFLHFFIIFITEFRFPKPKGMHFQNWRMAHFGLIKFVRIPKFMHSIRYSNYIQKSKVKSGTKLLFWLFSQSENSLKANLLYPKLTIYKYVFFTSFFALRRFGSAADLILKYRELVLRAIKDSILEGAVSATACVNAETKLTLSRSQAAKHIRLGETDWEARYIICNLFHHCKLYFYKSYLGEV